LLFFLLLLFLLLLLIFNFSSPFISSDVLLKVKRPKTSQEVSGHS